MLTLAVVFSRTSATAARVSASRQPRRGHHGWHHTPRAGVRHHSAYICSHGPWCTQTQVWRRTSGGRCHGRQGTRDCEEIMVAEFEVIRRRTRHAPIYGIGILTRSEEHTSELQSRLHLVCRLLLEKKHCPLQRGAMSFTQPGSVDHRVIRRKKSASSSSSAWKLGSSRFSGSVSAEE